MLLKEEIEMSVGRMSGEKPALSLQLKKKSPIDMVTKEGEGLSSDGRHIGEINHSM